MIAVAMVVAVVVSLAAAILWLPVQDVEGER
jgi:hypothetical protein